MDIGIATAYGVLCLSLIAVMNPYPAGSQSDVSVSGRHASEAVFSYVQSVGVVFLGDAAPAQVCASLAASSNSTLVLGGQIGSFTCPNAPGTFEGVSSFTMSLSGRQVTIEAWDEEQ